MTALRRNPEAPSRLHVPRRAPETLLTHPAGASRCSARPPFAPAQPRPPRQSRAVRRRTVSRSGGSLSLGLWRCCPRARSRLRPSRPSPQALPRRGRVLLVRWTVHSRAPSIGAFDATARRPLAQDGTGISPGGAAERRIAPEMAPDYERMADDALRIIDLLCRQPSVSAEGRALDETAELVEELLAGAGFETRQLRVNGSAPAVYGDQTGRADFTLLLYNHYDVQPVDPLDLWDSPPFEPVQRDGKLFARGTSDNKGEFAVRLAAIRALRDEDGELPLRIRWIVEGEEEVGSTNFDEIVRRHAELLHADGALWEGGSARLSDGRPDVGLGFKGALGVRLDVTSIARDAHSSLAAVAPSAAWRLVQALASIRDREGTVRIRGFYDKVLAATDQERRTIAASSFSEEEELRETLGLDGFVDGLSGAELWERASFTPTSNLAGISTGYSGPAIKTVLPARASAWMDFRLVPDQQPEEILELLRAHLDREGFADIQLTPIVTARPAKTPIDHPFVRRVVGVAEDVSGEPASIVPLAPPTLPIVASLQQHLAVPGLAAPDNPTYTGSGAHAPNEHIRLEDIQPALRFTYALLRELGTA